MWEWVKRWKSRREFSQRSTNALYAFAMADEHQKPYAAVPVLLYMQERRKQDGRNQDERDKAEVRMFRLVFDAAHGQTVSTAFQPGALLEGLARYAHRDGEVAAYKMFLSEAIAYALNDDDAAAILRMREEWALVWPERFETLDAAFPKRAFAAE